MSTTRFITRTIQGGKVRILGNDYVPDRDLPDRFEGRRAVFVLYKIGSNEYERRFVNLWGSRERYDAARSATSEADINALPDDEFAEDGVLKWQWWSRAN